jgi:Na+/proline symporter
MIFGIDGTIVVIALAGITALYLIFGGYFATSLSDFVQGIIMIVGVIIMFIFFFTHANVNGFEGLKELSANGFGLFPEYGNDGFLNSPLIMLLSLVTLTSLGVYGLPQTVHKYYSVRDKKAINQGMVITMIFALIVGFVAYFVGGLGHLFFDSEAGFGSNTDNIIPNMLMMVIPQGLLGLIGVLVLSASMSTLASVSLSSASVLSIDLYKGTINKKATDKKVTLIMRIMCFIFILISVVIAILNKIYNITAIAFLMSLSWGTLSGCFFGPFVLGLYSKKITKASAIASVIGGLVFTAVLTVVFGVIQCGGFGQGIGKVLQEGVALSPLTGVLCMAFSCIITVVVSLFTKKPNETVIKEAFEKEVENLIK